MSIYVLSYSEDFALYADIRQFLMKEGKIVAWKKNLPYCIFIRSTEDNVNILSKTIRFSFPGKRFLLVKVSKDRQGWLPSSAWDFLKCSNKK